jgi:hypothetical protein
VVAEVRRVRAPVVHRIARKTTGALPAAMYGASILHVCVSTTPVGTSRYRAGRRSAASPRVRGAAPGAS